MILHRWGIGLDVNTVHDGQRHIQLNRGELIGTGPDTPWVSPQEPALYMNRARDRDAWVAEVERTKPASFQRFRDSLQQSDYVKQLFDPWYMDGIHVMAWIPFTTNSAGKIATKGRTTTITISPCTSRKSYEGGSRVLCFSIGFCAVHCCLFVVRESSER